jgi:tRNA G18 (ribose-2'-O)-methylase SpoU
LTRSPVKTKDNGFFGIGIMNNVEELNIGTLWRSAYIMGASFIFTIAKRYKAQSSDVMRSWTKIPLYHYDSFEDLKANLPYSTRIVAVEMGEEAEELGKFEHPEMCVYLLGNERSGLSQNIIDESHGVVKLPGDQSLNVAVAGSIVMYDRINKMD